jgi:hypothetical protein
VGLSHADELNECAIHGPESASRGKPVLTPMELARRNLRAHGSRRRAGRTPVQRRARPGRAGMPWRLPSVRRISQALKSG